MDTTAFLYLYRLFGGVCMYGSNEIFVNMKICTGLLLVGVHVQNISLSLAKICNHLVFTQ